MRRAADECFRFLVFIVSFEVIFFFVETSSVYYIYDTLFLIFLTSCFIIARIFLLFELLSNRLCHSEMSVSCRSDFHLVIFEVLTNFIPFLDILDEAAEIVLYLFL